MSELYTFNDDTDFEEVFGDLNLTVLHSGEKHLVFVYGTLMTGMRNHHRMLNDGITLWGSKANLYGDFTMEARRTSSGYLAPIVMRNVPGDPHGIVNGEIYEVDNENLMLLDMFEGHPDVYRRERVTANYAKEGGDVGEITAWSYIYKNGDYRLENAQPGDEKAVMKIFFNTNRFYVWKGEEL